MHEFAERRTWRRPENDETPQGGSPAGFRIDRIVLEVASETGRGEPLRG